LERRDKFSKPLVQIGNIFLPWPCTPAEASKVGGASSNVTPVPTRQQGIAANVVATNLRPPLASAPPPVLQMPPVIVPPAHAVAQRRPGEERTQSQNEVIVDATHTHSDHANLDAREIL